MKKIWGLGALLLACGAGSAQIACSAGKDEGTGGIVNDHKMDDLIGSVPVSSKSLDGIGSIGLVYKYNYSGGAGFASTFDSGGSGPGVGGAVASGGSSPTGGSSPSGGSGGGNPYFYPQCTGTLISKTSVLTTRSCAQLFEQTKYGDYVSLQFVIGADPTQSSRRITVVDVEYAPSANSGSTYPDIGVLHLGESVKDVASFSVNVLSDAMIDKPFAVVGYGNSDLAYRGGTRRAGSLVLRSTSGLLYEQIFGSFDAFYEYVTSTGSYPSYYSGPYAGTDVTGDQPVFLASGGGGSVPFAGTGGIGQTGGSGPTAGFGGIGQTGGSGPTAGYGGGGNDWYRQYLESVYDNTELQTGEAYLGGAESDAQPCGADQGGPMVRKAQGQVRVFGVFSHTPFSSCDKGGVFSSITEEMKAFIDAAAQWTDPCTNLTVLGKCVGTNATRCSTPAEGNRRVVKFDCSLLNQVCVAPGTSEVTCTDK
ncbi:MAG TPA: trypsin-like serine protease [Polyangiaceae bacterium]|nr:trypsin-like serine protease [Polyangiaceae bacterium]